MYFFKTKLLSKKEKQNKNKNKKNLANKQTIKLT